MPGNLSQMLDAAKCEGELHPRHDAPRPAQPLKLVSMLVHRQIYAWTQAHPGKVDALLMLAGVLLLGLPTLATANADPAMLLMSAGILLPLAWRRSRPVLAGAVPALFCLLQVIFVGTPLPADLLVFPIVYGLAAHAPRWASLAGLGAALVGGVMFVVRYFSFPYAPTSGELFAYAFSTMAVEAMVLVFWTFGDLARTRRLAVQALEDRARRLEVERQQERDLAAADERSHIAREMHDIVAHSLSVIITQADGARYASADDPAVAPRTLGVIAETGRGSLREMRRLLGVLRGDEEASTRPLPSLADIEELLGSVKRGGVESALRIDGVPRRPLPPGAELTAYRVIQESLTNVLKHAGPGAQAKIVLQWTPAGLVITVRDDGMGAASRLYDDGAGQGINGMGERLALYDGTLKAAPAAGGGFRVEAFIPYTEA